MNRIKALRTSAEMKQSDLAQRLKVGQNTISNWENGRTEPDHGSLQTMASIFGVSVDYLLGCAPINAKEEPATVSGDGQAKKFAQALRQFGVDVDNLTDAEIIRIARLAKAVLEE